MSFSKRHFTAVVNSKEHGLYISSSPSSAARKIVSKLCSASKSKKVEFCVREITQGSKKKTYGPYLGEMKKLAKPIELKGRIIRYAPEVHLKKKKSATKTAKKIGKKMRGGGVRTTGIPSVDDFLIRKIPMDIFTSKIVDNYNGHSRTDYHIDLTETPYVNVMNNFLSQEPYLFFNPESNKMDTKSSKSIRHPNYRYYKYLVFNGGFRNPKEAIFKKLDYIEMSDGMYERNINNTTISDISFEELKQLRDFLFEQRRQDPSFCNTIYTAVVERTGSPEQQQHNNE